MGGGGKLKNKMSREALVTAGDSSGTVIDATPISVVQPPIASSYNDRIRPLLDCVDRLRNLKIMNEGIQLPTIVVVGDQSSGKSSVLESLAGISLPRGQGICTRVPLIMRLQSHPSAQPEIYLEYKGRTVPTDEDHITQAITRATDEIAGTGKGISNAPLSLIVKKNGVPDLTMVDLPGITRVPVHGQPEDIYEQISATIMEYIKPEESIILNVLSASVDFSTCESIRMSQKVDRTGERTLAVVTKVDKSPEGLLEKVISDDVNIGLGYICVRNRIDDESYEFAREVEAELFETHPLLSKLSKSMVGIPVLAEKLVHIQASLMSKCLPDIVRKINDKLSANIADLNGLPQKLTSVSEAMISFMGIISSTKESLKKILVRGEFDEYPEDRNMHCTARLADMFHLYSHHLNTSFGEYQPKNEFLLEDPNKEFLLEEIILLEEAKGIALPNFMPRTVFLDLLKKRTNKISAIPLEFVDKIWNYIESVVLSVLMHHSDGYPQLQSLARRASESVIGKKKEDSVNWVKEMIGMEELSDYTCNPEYISTWNSLMAKQDEFMNIVGDHSRPTTVVIEGFGEVDVSHLRLRNNLVVVQQAFDMKMRLSAYWKIVLSRMVDTMALHMLYSIHNLLNKHMEEYIVNDVIGRCGGGLDRMLEESPQVAEKRNRISNSVDLLKESKEVVSQIIDRISVQGE